MTTCSETYNAASCPVLCNSAVAATYNQEGCADYDYFFASPYGCDRDNGGGPNIKNNNDGCPQCDNSNGV